MRSDIKLFPNHTYFFSDSYNYTFNSMGSVLAIIILAYILQDSIDKSMIIYLHTSSMFGIIYINYKY